jgi:molecular chaperone HtpG
MTAERMQFKTEMKQLMDIIVNSLYSNKDIFLRELISNANDAIDKLRFEAITQPELTNGDADFKIKLLVDEEAKTLTISDNGIGMNRDTIVEDLGTIAKSGTRAFLQRLQETDAKDRPELIGQFGVGFYSAFMVADKVTVISRVAGESAVAVKWESDGQGEFVIEEADKPTRGTDVILHLNEAGSDYLSPWRLKHVVETFSDFVEHPIVMDEETPAKEEGGEPTISEKTLNRRQAIWLRRKSEITEDEYKEFYKHLTRDYRDPAKVVHFVAEGVLEFKALLYIPEEQPFGFLNPDDKKGVHLYIKRVFIQDSYENLLPRYLRFVRGVVDASDLPLNVSRELLQDNPVLGRIKNNLTDKIIDALTEMKKEEPDTYKKFFKQFGSMIREGIASDFERKDKLADLLLYGSTTTDADEAITLEQYVGRMPESQKEIFYLIGEKREQLINSPYLEAFKAKGFEVLLMTDPIDEWVVQALATYKEKPLKAADEGELDLDEKQDDKEEKKSEFKTIIEYLKEKLEVVKDIRLSNRLKASAAVLVRAEGDMGKHMEAIMKQLRPGEDPAPTKRILELNPEHGAVRAMLARYETDPTDPQVLEYAHLFYDQALLAEGRMVADPMAFARRINDLIVKAGN